MYLLTTISLDKEDIDAADSYLQKAASTKEVEENPAKLALVLNHRGVIFVERKKFKKAQQYFQKAYKLYPRFVGFLFNLALAYWKEAEDIESKKGEYTEVYKKAIEILEEVKKKKYNLNEVYEDLIPRRNP